MIFQQTHQLNWGVSCNPTTRSRKEWDSFAAVSIIWKSGYWSIDDNAQSEVANMVPAWRFSQCCDVSTFFLEATESVTQAEARVRHDVPYFRYPSMPCCRSVMLCRVQHCTSRSSAHETWWNCYSDVSISKKTTKQTAELCLFFFFLFPTECNQWCIPR